MFVACSSIPQTLRFFERVRIEAVTPKTQIIADRNFGVASRRRVLGPGDVQSVIDRGAMCIREGGSQETFKNISGNLRGVSALA